MLTLKCRFVFGIIKSIITGCFRVVEKICSLFNLQYTLLVLAVGAVLFITGAMSKNGTVATIFIAALILSVVLAVFLTVKKILPKSKKDDVEDKTQPQPTSEPVPIEEKQVHLANNVEEVPKYYRVKQNPNYIMAEYSDKYVLFLAQKGELKYIRTDYKAG